MGSEVLYIFGNRVYREDIVSTTEMYFILEIVCRLLRGREALSCC
jgi:hypothetical protein